RVRAIETVGARQQNRADNWEHPRIRHQRSAPDEQRRHEHVGQVVGDVVELGAVEPGNALAHAQPAREQAVGGVNKDLKPKPEETDAIVELEKGTRGEEGYNDAAGGIE